jgi:hypothetical protein
VRTRRASAFCLLLLAPRSRRLARCSDDELEEVRCEGPFILFVSACQAFYTKAKTWEGLLYACQVAQGRSIPVSLPQNLHVKGKENLKRDLNIA